MERPFISFGQTDRPPEDEHYDAAQLLVINLLRRFSETLIDELQKAAGAHERIVSEAIMEKAYFSSLYGKLRLMGAQEVAVFLKVAKQRVGELDKENSKFPKPVARLACGPIWLAKDIEKFGSGWERKPGRPRKETGT